MKCHKCVQTIYLCTEGDHKIDLEAVKWKLFTKKYIYVYAAWYISYTYDA